MTTVRDNLIAAKAMIDTPEKWIKGDFERDGCFCALGALSMAATGRPDDWGHGIEPVLEKHLPPGFRAGVFARAVAQFNDIETTTHADVMALFDRAISSQPTQEG